MDKMEEGIKSLTANIKEITEAFRRSQEAIQQIESLTKPMRNNLDEIPGLYEEFTKVSQRPGREYRMQFIMIILYFYSPASFVGGSIPFKIKAALSGLFNVSIRSIEYMAKDLLFLYDHYADFREGVDAGIEYIRKMKAI